jgi:hypothetical protein
MQLIYEKKGYITVSLNESPLYIIFDWTKLAVTVDELKDLHMKAYAFIQSKRVKTLIAETSKVTDVLFPEGIKWFGEEHVPRLAAAGLKRVVTVVPKIALSRFATKTWQAAVLGIELHNAASLEEALTLVIQ